MVGIQDVYGVVWRRLEYDRIIRSSYISYIILKTLCHSVSVGPSFAADRQNADSMLFALDGGSKIC